MAYPNSRRELIRETVKAWIEFYPHEARAFAKALKKEWNVQNKHGLAGGKAGKAGFRKVYSLPDDLVYTLAGIFQVCEEYPLFGQIEEDIRVIAQEFPDFLCRMNQDVYAKRRDSRPKALIT